MGSHGGWAGCTVINDDRLSALRHEAKLDEVGGDFGVIGRGEVRHMLDQGELEVRSDGGDEAPIEDA